MDKSDSEFKDWLISIKKKITVLLIFISFLLMCFGSYLVNIEGSDGVTALSGTHVSWTTTPYADIGNLILSIGTILFILSVIYFILILIKKKE